MLGQILDQRLGGLAHRAGEGQRQTDLDGLKLGGRRGEVGIEAGAVELDHRPCGGDAVIVGRRKIELERVGLGGPGRADEVDGGGLVRLHREAPFGERFASVGDGERAGAPRLHAQIVRPFAHRSEGGLGVADVLHEPRLVPGVVDPQRDRRTFGQRHLLPRPFGQVDHVGAGVGGRRGPGLDARREPLGGERGHAGVERLLEPRPVRQRRRERAEGQQDQRRQAQRHRVAGGQPQVGGPRPQRHRLRRHALLVQRPDGAGRLVLRSDRDRVVERGDRAVGGVGLQRGAAFGLGGRAEAADREDGGGEERERERPEQRDVQPDRHRLQRSGQREAEERGGDGPDRPERSDGPFQEQVATRAAAEAGDRGAGLLQRRVASRRGGVVDRGHRHSFPAMPPPPEDEAGGVRPSTREAYRARAFLQMSAVS